MEENLLKQRVSILKMLLIFACIVLITDVISKYENEEVAVITFILLRILSIFIVIFVMKRNKIKWSSLFSVRKINIVVVFLAFMSGFFLLFFDSGLNGIIEHFFKNHQTPSSQSAKLYWPAYIVILYGAFIAPFFEEVEFRGLLFSVLNGGKNKLSIKSVLLVSFMFFILHTGAINSGAFIMSAISCFLFFYGRTLIYSIALHFGGNIIILIPLLFSGEQQMSNLVVDESYLLADIIFILFFGFLVFVCSYLMFWILQRNYKEIHLNSTSPKNAHKINEKRIDYNFNRKEIIVISAYFIICFISWMILIIN